jgi:protein SCO1
MKFRSYAILCFLAIVGAYTCACSFYGSDKRFERSGNEKRYELKGKVVSVDKVNQMVIVSHEDIKDYMPAMTMPFTLRDAWPYDVLKPGDLISATLIVDGPRSWLEDVIITQETTDSQAVREAGGIPEATAGGEVPNYGLVNQDGNPIKIHDYRGKTLVLTFIYTRCPLPEYCTLMSNNFADINQELKKQPDLYNQSHLLSISIDPEYDKPAVLRSYGAAHTGNYSDEKFDHWEFAGGTIDQIKGIAQYFGLRYYEDKDQIVHGLRTVVIQPDGKIYKVYSGNEWKPDQIVSDITFLTHKHS